MQLKTIVFVVVIAYGAFHAWQGREIKHAPGEIAPDSPVQTDIDNAHTKQIEGYTITPLANFDITARVLSKTNYHADREADLSPVDLTLGWGAMSDEAVLSKISISQSRRFYFWRVDEFPIPREEIETHSANMHMIPETDEVAETLDKVREGHVVKISGYLVQAKANDGWTWTSSLSRNDTGNGACELILVKALSIKR